MIWKTLLNMLTVFFLQVSTESRGYLLINALYIFGMWGIFQKCGVKG